MRTGFSWLLFAVLWRRMQSNRVLTSPSFRSRLGRTIAVATDSWPALPQNSVVVREGALEKRRHGTWWGNSWQDRDMRLYEERGGDKAKVLQYKTPGYDGKVDSFNLCTDDVVVDRAYDKGVGAFRLKVMNHKYPEYIFQPSG